MKFTYNSRIIKHLGTELITSDEVAVMELIKNSYDAEATKVNIHFLSESKTLAIANLLHEVPELIKQKIDELKPSGLIILEDDGKGMNYETLKKGFFEVGSDLKAKKKSETHDDNDDEQIILGDKGIGRLSAQRLAPTLLVETTSSEEKKIILVQVDWEEFINNIEADAPEWLLPKNQEVAYTRLWLIGTESEPIDLDRFVQKQEFYQLDIEGNPSTIEEFLTFTQDLQSALSFLYSPFEEKGSLVKLKAFRDTKRLTLDFNSETLKLAESIHWFETRIVSNQEGSPIDLEISMHMEIRPWFLERIHYKEVGNVLFKDWKRNPKEYNNFLTKYKNNYSKSLTETVSLTHLIRQKRWKREYLHFLLRIAPVEGKIYSFKRDRFLINIALNSAEENYFISNKKKVKEDIKNFLDTNNGIKLYRNQFRIATIGNKDNDWLQLQQKRTSGQQFYRFELGNVIGFIKVNDIKQQYIYETSSREHLTDNQYEKALRTLLDYILDVFSPNFTRRAVEITKDILDVEKLIPRNNTIEIEKKVDQSQQVLLSAKENINAIRKAIREIGKNIELDTDEQKDAVQKVFRGLSEYSDDFTKNIEDTQKSFEFARKSIEISHQERKRIEVDTYNNYKLMANGLITEVITHELHSILSSKIEEEEYQDHFQTLKKLLFREKEYQINNDHLDPIKKRFEFLHGKMNDINRFYAFLEKTFIYSGDMSDFDDIDVNQYLKELESRFQVRFKKHGINLDYTHVTNTWQVPKGSLMHIFYNLIDNAIYWIEERQKRLKYDASYARDSSDKITIRTIDENTIWFYDSGTGVLDKFQFTLFNPLETGKKNGRGMGLHIVRNFLKSFGGDIELLSERNIYNNRYIFEIRLNSTDRDD